MCQDVDLRKTYRKFIYKNLFCEYKLFVFNILILTICQSIVTLCVPYFYKILIDEVFEINNEQMFIKVIIIMAGCYLGNALLSIGKNYYLSKIQNGVEKKLRRNLNRKISKLEYSFFDSHCVGDILSRYNKEINLISRNVNLLLNNVIKNVISLVCGSIIIFIMNKKVFLLTLFFLMVYYFESRFWTKFLKNLSKECMENNTSSVNCITETYRNTLLTKMYNAYDYVEKKFSDIYFWQYKNTIKLDMLFTVNISMGYIIATLLTVITWFFGGLKIFDKTISVGILVALINYQSLVINPIDFFSNFNNSLQEAQIALKRIYEILLSKEEKLNKGNVIEFIEKIEFKEVSFGYVDGYSILENMSLCLEKGNMIAIIGESGCGKSTLAKLLVGLYGIKAGNISFNGVSINKINLCSLRDKVALVCQDALFFRDTIISNMSLEKEIDMKQLEKYGSKLDIEDEIQEMPDGWYTILADNAANISVGQGKRLDIIRALLKNADVIVFDESSANIDQKRRINLFNLLIEIKREKIIIMITHNLEELKYFDNIYEIREKKLYRSL